MATDHDDAEFRRYLLGELPDEPAATLERDYFAREDLFDHVRAAESDLVDDYLAGRLSRTARDRFERHYLATPLHRHRLAVASELRGATHPAMPVRASTASQGWWAAIIDSVRRSWQPLTAALAVAVLFVGAWLWMVRSGSVPIAITVSAPEVATPSRQASRPPAPAEGQTPERQVPEASPRVSPVTVTVVLSPLSVRGANEAPILTMPPNAGAVIVRLVGDAGAVVVRGRAVVRTVSGRTVWDGQVTGAGNSPGEIARIEIPAATLPPEDYIVSLFDTNRDGRNAERARYFLRVRPD